MMFGRGGGKLWCGQGTGDRGGTLFSPQALMVVQLNYFCNYKCMGGEGRGGGGNAGVP